jgi:hypothetical protein
VDNEARSQILTSLIKSATRGALLVTFLLSSVVSTQIRVVRFERDLRERSDGGCENDIETAHLLVRRRRAVTQDEFGAMAWKGD